MSYLNNATSVEILRVQEDDLGPYAKIKVSRAGNEIVIRWGLDAFTYGHLKTLVFTQLLDLKASAPYKCYLSFDGILRRSGENTAWVISRLGTQSTRLSFPCSDLFVGNLTWLENIGNVEELRSLSWDDWIAHENHERILNLAAHSAAAVQERVPRRRRSTGVILSAVAILCIAAALVWYCLWRPFAAAKSVVNASPSHKVIVHRVHPKPKYQSIVKTTSQIAHTPSSAKDSSLALNVDSTSTNALPIRCTEVYQVPTGDVALTIDDGPSPYTAQILSILAEHHVHATFFFVGVNVRRFPDVVKAAAEQGNEIGDHSVDHGDLTKMSKTGQEREILGAASEIEQVTLQPVSLFRPPYDAFNNITKEILNENHFYLALWNQDPEDWKATSPKQVEKQVLSRPASGSVFILHDKEDTMLALPNIIEALQTQHLHFVVLPTSTSALAHPASAATYVNHTAAVAKASAGSNARMRRY